MSVERSREGLICNNNNNNNKWNWTFKVVVILQSQNAWNWRNHRLQNLSLCNCCGKRFDEKKHKNGKRQEKEKGTQRTSQTNMKTITKTTFYLYA